MIELNEEQRQEISQPELLLYQAAACASSAVGTHLALSASWIGILRIVGFRQSATAIGVREVFGEMLAVRRLDSRPPVSALDIRGIVKIICSRE